MNFHYIGSGAYCYANSTTMALSATGKDYDPSYVECLTTVAISAASYGTPAQHETLFSSFPPDAGVSRALTTLGYEFDHALWPKDAPNADAAFAQLAAMLQHGPVVVGPVDMGKLMYYPNPGMVSGADHYVCVYAIEGETVHLHDPERFPYVSLTKADFISAWEGKGIDYATGAYQMWGNLRQVSTPSADEVFAVTDEHVRGLIAQQRIGKAPYELEVGPAAMHALADEVAAGVTERLHGHLTYFLLPLAAKRCSDYARFYAPYDATRASLKDAQGQACGDAFVALGRKDWPALSAALHQVADLEEQFQAASVPSRELAIA